MTPQRPLSLNIRPCSLSSLGFLSPKLLEVQALSLLFPVKGISKDKEKARKLCDDWGEEKSSGKLSNPIKFPSSTQNTYLGTSTPDSPDKQEATFQS